MISLYIHIPFCASRCPYCDFATAPATSALRSRYMAGLRAEIAREGHFLGRPSVATVYVGGGTPSLLEPAEIASLASEVRAAFDLRLGEATFEANPATLDRARLQAWRQFGITRISLGAQSLDERGLRAVGRTHQAADVAPAVEAARSCGFDVNLDLIFGWPGQTPRDWKLDLDRALALGPDHLSAYPLELALEPEDGAANWPGGWPAVGRWRRDAHERQPDDDAVAALYEIAERRLARAGYRHYEIANWARPGKRSRHNLVYWRGGNWLGVGAGAHSHLGGVRSRNAGALVPYLERIEGGCPRILEPSDAPSDAAMLALRLDDGLDLARHAERFGRPDTERIRAALRSLDGARLLRWSGQRVRLTPRGRLLANEVFVRLLPD